MQPRSLRHPPFLSPCRRMALVHDGVNIYGVPIAPARSRTRRRQVDNRPPVTDRREAGIVEEFMPTCTSPAQVVRCEQFCDEAAALGVKVTVGEPLARHTTFRIGGPADLYAAVNDGALLMRLVALAKPYAIPVTVLGGGSNVLISDAGVAGLVISNQTRTIQECVSEPVPAGHLPQVVADSGVALAGLARWTVQAGWSGLEWAVSVPGTVGGAVIGNAGAHGGDIAGALAWAQVSYGGQPPGILTPADLAFAYRSSALKRQLAAQESEGSRDSPLVVAAGFNVTQGDAAEMAARADAFLARRRASQPVEPSAGSIFRNPAGDHAGRLIEAAGLKGHRIGGAQISPRHANFIINTGDAVAEDVLALIELVRERVSERFGLTLIPEIVFLGWWATRPAFGSLRKT